MEPSEESPFTICGFSTPHKVQWMNLSKALTLSELFEVIGMVETSRILEIAVSTVSVNGGPPQAIILNIKKDIDHKHCSFDISRHEPRHRDDDESSCSDDDDFESMTISEEKQDDVLFEESAPTPTARIQLNLSTLKSTTPERTERAHSQNHSSASSYPQCMDRYDHIPIHNDYIRTDESPPSSNSSSPVHSSHSKKVKHEITNHHHRQQKSQYLALEELFAILCWNQCPKFAVKMQFADTPTLEMATSLIQKYSGYFQLDSMSCLWYHGVLLHQFPMSNARHSLKKVFGSTGSTAITFSEFTKNVKKVPALTYSLSWPSYNGNVTKSPGPLKVCLSSILSEIAIGKEHDIVVHFPIQHIYECCHCLNDLITNKSYFPYLAFNFFNVYRNPHNFDFSAFSDESNPMRNGNASNLPQSTSSTSSSSTSTSSWNLFRRGDKSKSSKHMVSPSTGGLSENEMVCKTTVNWLSSHLHHLFCFTSITRVRLRNTPNDAFRRILGQHRVPQWTGRLSWNPRKAGKSKRDKTRHSVKFNEPLSPLGSTPPLYTMPTLSPTTSLSPTSSFPSTSSVSPTSKYRERGRPPDIQWDLWQIARVDRKSKHFQSCIYNGNIGLAPKSGGWLLSTRALRPPYRIKGRFFAGDKPGVLSVYIRCSGVEYAPSNEAPAFGVGVHIGNEKMKMVTHRLQSKPMKQECGIGTNRDNSYNFQINDRGPMYPIVYQVEMTGKDGRGDNLPKGQKLHVPYPRDSTHWMYYVVLSNASSEWILIDRLQIYEKN